MGTPKVKTLLDAGADPNASNAVGMTILMGAALAGNTEGIQSLLDAGADFSPQDDYGFTALMRAEENGHTEIAEPTQAGGGGGVSNL